MSSARLAKLPPDPEILEDLKLFRAFNAEVATVAIEVIRIVAPGVFAEATEAKRQGLAARTAGEAEAVLAADPEYAERIAPLAKPTGPRKPPNPREIAAIMCGLPKTPASPMAIFIACSRVLRLCTSTSIRLNNTIAGAYTTAEMRRLTHPARQEIAAVLHKSIDALPPGPIPAAMKRDSVETRLNEELGWRPDSNPADLAASICQAFSIPENKDLYPTHWRPTPTPKAETPGAAPAPMPPPEAHSPERPRERPQERPREPTGLWANVLAEVTAEPDH